MKPMAPIQKQVRTGCINAQKADTEFKVFFVNANKWLEVPCSY